VIAGSFSLFGRLGSEFMPNADPGELAVEYKAAPGISLERSLDIGRQITSEIRKNPAVQYTYTSLGSNGAKPFNEGQVYVHLIEREKRPHFRTVMADLRERLSRFRAVRVGVGLYDASGNSQKPVEISVRGTELNRVNAIGQRLMDEMKAVPGAADVDTSEEQPRPEVRVILNRKAAGDLGLDLGTVASTLRGLVAGDVVSQFEDPDGDSYDVRLRADPSHRAHAADLLDLDLPGRMGTTLVPLSQVAFIDDGTAPSKILHRDLVREVRLVANTQGRSLGEVIADVKARAANIEMPPGYSISYTGQAEDMAESFGYVGQSLMLAVILIYAILASQFRSFLQPFAIMLSLPLSLAGVAGLLYLANDTLNIMSMIGVILLMGLVTKNAILLVDFANVRRRDGTGRTEALIAAARVRLRPIIMTTLAMIFGMLPLAFEWGKGAEFRAPMARAVIGGLITSTLLTLVAVPVVYTLVDDLGSFAVRVWTRGRPSHNQAAQAAAGD